MEIGSTLAKGMMRRIGGQKKSQLQCSSSDSSKTNSSFRNVSSQGDSDSEATSFSSSMQGSTSSAASSTDRYSSGMEVGNQQRKTVDKVNSKKPAAFGRVRSSRRRPQSRLMSLPDDGPATTRQPSTVESSEAAPDLGSKPVQKFTRSGSLRSLKILRKKNISSSETQPSTVKDSHSKKATFSSILKDSKFPKDHVGVTEPEVPSTAKLCPYEHCSLHGHHHNHEPPVKRFSYLKRRSSKDQKRINPQTRATDKHSVKKKEVKVTKNDVDFSIEFYAKTRPDPSFEPSCSRDDVLLADIMFGVNGDDQNEVRNDLHMDGQDHSIVNIDGENDSLDGFADVEGNKPGFNSDIQMSMWRIIHRHMLSGLIDQLQEEKQSGSGDDDVDHGKEIQQTFAVKMVREAIEKILLAEEDGSEKNPGDDQNEPNQAANDPFGSSKDKPNGWSHVKKFILMRRFITELENAKKRLDPNNLDKRGHIPLAPKPKREPEPEAEAEAEIVSLRRRTTGEKKNSNEWMIDYALQQVVAELAPIQKRKVALLVKSFETVTPKLEKQVAI